MMTDSFYFQLFPSSSPHHFYRHFMLLLRTWSWQRLGLPRSRLDWWL